MQIRGELDNWLPELTSDLQWHELGFEADCLPFAAHHRLSEGIKAKQLNLELIPTTNLVEHLRCIKEPGELELIIKAVELIDAAFEQLRTIIHPGVTERKAAWEIEEGTLAKTITTMIIMPVTAPKAVKGVCLASSLTIRLNILLYG